MVDSSIDLDLHRGMMAQVATELRRLRTEVEADQASLKARQEELEKFFAAAPAAGWPEAVEKARYLLGLLSQTSSGQDPRRRSLIDGLSADFDRLLSIEPADPGRESQ